MRNIQGIANETATIASAASLSAVINLQGRTLAAIQMPGTWTAANLTFQVSLTEDGTYTDMTDPAGTEYMVVAVVSKGISLDAVAFIGWNFMKIRSGTASVPVAQGGARSLALNLVDIV